MCEKIRENFVCPALKLNVCKFVQQRLCFSGDLYFANLSREGLWSSLSSDTSYFANWRQKTAFLDWIEIKKDSFYSSGRGKKCICTWIRKIAVFCNFYYFFSVHIKMIYKISIPIFLIFIQAFSYTSFNQSFMKFDQIFLMFYQSFMKLYLIFMKFYQSFFLIL